MTANYLSGLALKNFRGIGEDGVRLGGFQKINFFIGPNNSGKSTILNFLANYLHRKDEKSVRNPWSRQYVSTDVRLGRSSDSIKFALGVTVGQLVERLPTALIPRFGSDAKKIGETFAIDGMVWLTPTHDGRSLEFEIADKKTTDSALSGSAWRDFWNGLTSQTGGGLSQHWIPETLQKMAQYAAVEYPNVRFIPAIRQISEAGAEFTDYSGSGLIDRLAELQNPPHNERHKRVIFDKINAFLQSVTDTPDARIEVPHDRRHLLVDMDGKMLPLASLGTGIHEVIMLASFCTLVENEIVCVEEPEIHLHPLLQRKLVRYLSEKTANQYFIATHSASVLDAVEASVFSVQNIDGATRVSLAVESGERYEICRRLGYHASDILQANSIVWVEGPSDRIYLNHWISNVDPTLIEGTDYSIMFYGGRLLSHLTASDEEVSEFISLRRLNRNMIVLIDSDKNTAHDRINATKSRLVTELGDSACWVTAGREIENYVSLDLIEESLRNVYPHRFGEIADKGRYGRRLCFIDKVPSRGVFADADKIKVAQYVASRPADLGELDLAKRISALTEIIRAAGPKSS